MTTYDASLNNGGRGFTLRLTVTQSSQDITNNTSTLAWSLVLIKGANSYSSWTKNWSINIDGQTSSGSIAGYDFRTYSSLTLGSGTKTVTHNADGTKTAAVSGTFDEGSHVLIGTGTASGTFTPTTIPRATTPTVSPTSGETAATYTITHAPASSAFYHDVAYSLDGGATYTNIDTNVIGTDTTTSWSPAHSLFPSSSGGTAIIRLITRSSSGGTIIGTNTVNLPLTVPSSVKPTISAVAWADTQTASPDLPTLMGGTGRYVQRWSKLQPTLTSAGAGGSTVLSSLVTQNGQVTTSGVAFTNPVDLSGSVPFTATVTDTRARASDTLASTVAVTAYNYPSLPTPTVTRTSDSGGTTPSPTGTYLKITPTASVSSLLFSASEKNLLEWRVRTKPAGGSYTTVQDWTASTVSGTTWTTPYVAAGPYAANTQYVVEVSIRDLFGKNSFRTSQTVVSLEISVPSESVFMDWNQGVGIGLGKYHSPANGILDIQGNTTTSGFFYQDGGKQVLDADDIVPSASATVQGKVELATDAETATGTDSARAITPSGLSSLLLKSSANYLLNSNFEIWQRGVSVVPTSTDPFSADRWESYRGSYVAGMTVARQTITDLPGLRYCARVQRNSGNTSTQTLYFNQVLETATSRTLAGKTVTFSFYARKGANYSPASGALIAYLTSGTGTDQNIRVGMTSQANIISQTIAPTTTWTRYEYSTLVSDSVTQLAVRFEMTPTGTAGTNDYFEVTGVQLERGPRATSYEPQCASFGLELSACQRFFQSFVAQVADQRIAMGVQVTNLRAEIGMYLPAILRRTPTMAISNLFWTDARTFNSAISSLGFYGYHGFMPAQGNFTSFEVNFASAGTAGDGGFIRCTSGGYLQLNAEL